MSLFFLILTVIIAVALISVILIQNPKTGALGATFNVRQTIGPAKSNLVAEKVTWGLAVLMLALCLGSGIII